MKKKFSYLLAIVSICIMSVGVLLYFAPIPVTQRKSEKAAFSAFEENRNTFEDIAKNVSRNNNLLKVLLDVDYAHYLDVPDELSEIGIESICIIDDVVYFEYYNSIMGVTPFGILYTNDISVLDNWYQIKQIEDDWYYYRIVS